MPVSAIEEILLEGPSIARNYLKNPFKTNDAFRENLDFIDRLGKRRVYQTEDLTRYSPEENVIYLDRNDTQIKLHEQRLEPAEIKSHIMDSHFIRHAQVVLSSHGPYQKTLVAIVSMKGLSTTLNENHKPLRLVDIENALMF